MPTKNDTFKTALQASSLDTRPGVVKALNDLLAAGEIDASAFRKAILTNVSFWNGIVPGFNVTATDIDDDNFLMANGSKSAAGKEVPTQNFNAFIRLAAKKRVLLTLKEANETILTAIVNETNNDEVRKKLFGADGNSTFGEPAVKVANWSPANENIINNTDIDDIKKAARQQLLFKKIVACDDQAKLNALLESKDNATFLSAAKALFAVQPGVPHFIDTMSRMQFTDAMKKAAIKKAISLDINALPIRAIPKATIDNLYENLDKSAAEFLKSVAKTKELGVIYSGLQDNTTDVLELKGQLAARLLPVKYATSAELESIAKATDAQSLLIKVRGFETAKGKKPGDYLEKAITADSIGDIRQEAAMQALGAKIVSCENRTALTELMSVTNLADLKQKLATLDALGFQGDTSDNNLFRDALTEANVAEVVAYAHLRKNLSLAPENSEDEKQHLNELRALIVAPDPFVDAYLATFKDQPNNIQTIIRNVLNEPDTASLARLESLLTYARHTIDNPELVNEALLISLAAPKSKEELVSATNLLLGFRPEDDRVSNRLDLKLDGHVAREIKKLAIIEQTLRDSQKAVDLSSTTGDTNHSTLLEKINQFPKHLGINQVPLTAKHKIQAHLVTSLVKNYPKDRLLPLPAAPTPDKLTGLAKAATMDAFKTALTAIGVTDHAWVKQDTMEQVQKAACTQVIKLDLGQHLRFSTTENKLHTTLMTLVEQLPLARQRVLVEKPKILVELSQATTPEQIALILGQSKVASKDIKELAASNARQALLAKIANPEIAKLFAAMTIIPPLTTKNINQINAIILDSETKFDKTVVPPATKSNYQLAVDSMIAVLNLPSATVNSQPLAAKLNEIFGNDTIRENIERAQGYNQQVLSAYQSASTPRSKVVYASLASLSKKALLPETTARAIVADVVQANTYAEFMSKAAKNPLINDKDSDKLDPPWTTQLSPAWFSRVKKEASREMLRDEEFYKQESEALEPVYRRLELQFSDLKLKSDDPLERFANAKLDYWFPPLFQALAKGVANEVGPHLRELSSICDTMVDSLKLQLAEVQNQKQGLPDEYLHLSTWHKSEVGHRWKRLSDLASAITSEKQKLERLQLLFKGNPNAGANASQLEKEGLLETLRLAEEGKTDLKMSAYQSVFGEDQPLSKKEELLAARGKAQAKPMPAGHTVISGGGFKDGMATVGMVKPGEFRHYKSYSTQLNPDGTPQTDRDGNPKKYESSYIEERGSTGGITGRIDSEGKHYYVPDMKLTVIDFPPKDQPQAAVGVAMEIAARMLVAHGGVPSAKNPITIDGSDSRIIEYLWTAFVAIGKNDPNMRFDQTAIKIPTEFNFKSSTLFKDHFEQNRSYTNYLDNIKVINELKFGKAQQKENKTLETASAQLIQHYKQNLPKLEQAKKQVEEQKETSLDTSRQGPGMS